jgi:hypothetical protein
MSLKAKGLISLMLSLHDEWDYSIAGLATLSKDGKDSIMSALGELEKFGYLTRTRLTDDKGRFAGVEYNIYEVPQPKKPVAENTNEGNENAGNPNAENRTQSNTNSINYLLDKIYDLLNTNDPELLTLYREYIKARDNMNAPLTESGLESLIKRAKRLSKNNVRVEKIILESAIINGWKNVYMPRETELQAITQEITDELRGFFGLE